METLSPWLQLVTVVLAALSAVGMIKRSLDGNASASTETFQAINEALSNLSSQAEIVSAEVKAIGVLVKDLTSIVERLDRRVTDLEIDRAEERGARKARAEIKRDGGKS